MATIRPAREDDLPEIHFVYYVNEVGEEQASISPSPETVPPMLQHIFESGTLYVAEEDGRILAYAGAITRGPVTFLTDLFVHPRFQSSGLGKSLLQSVLPSNSQIHCTVSSIDPRAQALYTRLGMQPIMPNFNLRWQGAPIQAMSSEDVEIIEAQNDDSEILRWDALVSGRIRPQDHIFWRKKQQGTALWFRRQGAPLGYGYVRLDIGTPDHPRCTVGPLGVMAAEHATACVLAATNWAQQRAAMVRIDVLGPHPSLAPLLENGFHIVYVETFHTAATTPFFDARCYIPSGSDLF